MTEIVEPLVDGDKLEASTQQKAIVALSAAVTLSTATKAILMLVASGPTSWVMGSLALIAGVEFADIGSGVYHWAMDNYGSPKTPIFGSQIAGFQGHHTFPWTITHRDTANNIAPVC